MLFKASITPKVVRDENTLVEQLYIFLREYVPTRLIYESTDTHEDCIQDTIMFILKRYKELYKEMRANNPLDLINFNYEKWFYNRARSYVSFWLRRIVRERKQLRDYIETAIYFQSNDNDYFEPSHIDYNLLETIVIQYKLNDNDSRYLLQTIENMLENIGYTTDNKYSDIDIDEKIKHIPSIAHAVVDEYIVESGSKDI